MYEYRTLIALISLITAASLSACVSERSAYDHDRGHSVRNMIASQTHDPLALVPPPPAAKGLDGQKGDAVLEAYRGNVGDPSNVGKGDTVTAGFAD